MTSLHTTRLAASPAFPGQPHDAQGAPCGAHEYGLTKREYFAAMALRSIGGMALNGDDSPNDLYYRKAARCAVAAADALIDALTDEKEVAP